MNMKTDLWDVCGWHARKYNEKFFMEIIFQAFQHQIYVQLKISLKVFRLPVILSLPNRLFHHASTTSFQKFLYSNVRHGISQIVNLARKSPNHFISLFISYKIIQSGIWMEKVWFKTQSDPFYWSTRKCFEDYVKQLLGITEKG